MVNWKFAWMHSQFVPIKAGLGCRCYRPKLSVASFILLLYKHFNGIYLQAANKPLVKWPDAIAVVKWKQFVALFWSNKTWERVLQIRYTFSYIAPWRRLQWSIATFNDSYCYGIAHYWSSTAGHMHTHRALSSRVQGEAHGARVESDRHWSPQGLCRGDIATIRQSMSFNNIFGLKIDVS